MARRSASAWTLRTAPTMLTGLLSTLFVSVLLREVARGGSDSPLVERILRLWGWSWLIPAGARVRVEGREHIQPGQSYVVVSNHQSNLDAMVHLAALGLPLRIMAKRELFALPILGPALRAIGMVEVDRARPDVVAIDSAARDVLASGRSLLVYPEATTSSDGTIHRFKSGAFAIAIGQGVPVLPVVLHGTRLIWAPGGNAIRGGQVRVAITEPITTCHLTPSDIAGLRDDVRAVLSSTLAVVSGAHI